MNKIISQDEISVLSDMKPAELNVVVAQMVSLTNALVSGKNDTDSMVESLEKQPWYRRMLFTLIGKNKATKEEIAQKKNQISVYAVQAIGSLYEMGKIHEDIISSLGQKINDVYHQITLNSFEQIMIKDSIINLKDMVETITVKLNNKIEKVDSFTMLNEEIKQGIYNDDNAMVSVCGILSHLNIDVLKDERKMEIIKRSINEMNVFSDTEKPLIAFMDEVAAMPIDKTGMAYLELSSMSDNLFASIFSSFMEKYNMLPKMERMAKEKDLIVKKIVDEFDINANAEFSSMDLFNSFVDSKCEISYIDSSFLPKDNDIEDTCNTSNKELQTNELDEQENGSVENENYVDIDAIVDEIMEATGLEEQKHTADVDFDSIFEYDEETSIPDVLTEVTLSSIMQIKENEVKTFSYNIIHINTNINCAGTLIFKNCVIYYNDSGSPSGIQLERTSNISFFNCKIVMTEERENCFIKGTVTSLFIKDSTFENCAKFCNVNVQEKFLMDNCYVYRCYKDFLTVDGYYSEAKNGIIANNCIIVDRYSDSYFTEFNLRQGKINNVTVIGFKSGDEDRYTSSSFIYLNEANNCTFINAKKCLEHVNNVKNCQFWDCNNVIKVSPRKYNDKKCEINNCFFKNCEMTIENGHDTNTTVSYCQFLSCYSPSIASYSPFHLHTHSINIEYCEFINILSYNAGNSSSNFRISRSFIAINRQNNKESELNTISNCIFNGAHLNDTHIGDKFLIEPLNPAGDTLSVLESRVKPKDRVIEVRDCSFMNCTANKDLIKMQVKYDTLFKKDLSFDAVYTYGCSGLKDVNKGNFQTDNYVEKKTNTSGEPIGSSFANTYTVDELKDPAIVKKNKGRGVYAC